LRQGLLLGELLAEFDKLGVEGLLTSGEREVFGFERCNALFFWKNILVLGGRKAWLGPASPRHGSPRHGCTGKCGHNRPGEVTSATI
jgi:hypothetical protein